MSVERAHGQLELAEGRWQTAIKGRAQPAPDAGYARRLRALAMPPRRSRRRTATRGGGLRLAAGPGVAAAQELRPAPWRVSLAPADVLGAVRRGGRGPESRAHRSECRSPSRRRSDSSRPPRGNSRTRWRRAAASAHPGRLRQQRRRRRSRSRRRSSTLRRFQQSAQRSAGFRLVGTPRGCAGLAESSLAAPIRPRSGCRRRVEGEPCPWGP